jgi:hypothetical protein
VTAAKRAKELGAKSLQQITDAWGCTPQNIRNTFKTRPHQFDIIVLGVLQSQKSDNIPKNTNESH